MSLSKKLSSLISRLDKNQINNSRDTNADFCNTFNIPSVTYTKLEIIDELDILSKKRSTQIVDTANRIVKQISKTDNIQKIIEIIADYSTDAILTIDSFGNIEAINKTVVSMFNYNIHELKNINIKGIIPKFNFESTGSEFIELAALKRDTQELFIEINVNKIENKRFILLIKDITYNKELISKNTTLSSILESLMYNNPNPVYHKNSNLKYVGCNKAFEKLTGFSSNFIFGSTVNEIFSENISKLSDIKDKD